MIPAPAIIFDTDCILCSGMVAFVLAHERDKKLSFVGAWSNEGLALAAEYDFSRQDLNETFLVIKSGIALTQSDAGIAVLKHLRAPWRWLMVLRFCPKPIRDAVYRVIARHRYRWFGRRENCTLVPPAERHRFIGVKSE
jgi:predicted DCC family thiol-disulfide oxidoreductase YuxK